MSGIYLPNMEMPKACVYRENGHLITCPLYDIDGYCGALKSEVNHKEEDLPSNCPLVHVPEHGDLVDKQYAYQSTMTLGERTRKIVLKQIDALPVVIPADKEGEG